MSPTTQPEAYAAFLAHLGFAKTPRTHFNLTPALLYEESLRRNEALLAAEGPIVAHTGTHTGRSANDRFIVRDAETDSRVHWGAVNKPLSPESFARLKKKVV